MLNVRIATALNTKTNRHEEQRNDTPHEDDN